MPNPSKLQVGDRIRLLRVPETDLNQRERETESNAEMAGWTADTIERIIEQTPIVVISRIDDDGCAWYETTIVGPTGSED